MLLRKYSNPSRRTAYRPFNTRNPDQSAFSVIFANQEQKHSELSLDQQDPEFGGTGLYQELRRRQRSFEDCFLFDSLEDAAETQA